MRGINGDINKADADAITATLLDGKQESIAWTDLGPKATNKLLQLAVRREVAGDWLAAGSMSLMDQDTQTAERYFDKSAVAGRRNLALYGPAGHEGFCRRPRSIRTCRYAESETLLTALKAKYGTIPWFAANKPEFEAAVNDAQRPAR